MRWLPGSAPRDQQQLDEADEEQERRHPDDAQHQADQGDTRDDHQGCGDRGNGAGVPSMQREERGRGGVRAGNQHRRDESRRAGQVVGWESEQARMGTPQDQKCDRADRDDRQHADQRLTRPPDLGALSLVLGARTTRIAGPCGSGHASVYPTAARSRRSHAHITYTGGCVLQTPSNTEGHDRTSEDRDQHVG